MLELFVHFPKFSTGFESLSKDEKHCTVSYYLFETFWKIASGMSDDFYTMVDSGDPAPDNEHITGVREERDEGEQTTTQAPKAMYAARIAVYDDMLSTPRVSSSIRKMSARIWKRRPTPSTSA